MNPLLRPYMKSEQILLISMFKQRSKRRYFLRKKPRTPCEVCKYFKHFLITRERLPGCRYCVVGWPGKCISIRNYGGVMAEKYVRIKRGQV